MSYMTIRKRLRTASGATIFAIVAASVTSVYGTAYAAEGNSIAHHLPGVFVGVTSGGGETDYTLGIEYEYRFNQWFGLGIVGEHTPNRHFGDGVSVALGTIHYHPFGAWRVTAGYGYEDVHDASLKRSKGKLPTKNEDVIRIGVSYDFHVGKFGIAPSASVDFVGGKEVGVIGVSLIRPF